MSQKFTESMIRETFCKRVKEKYGFDITKRQSTLIAKSMILSLVSFTYNKSSKEIPTLVYFENPGSCDAMFILKWNRKINKWYGRFEFDEKFIDDVSSKAKCYDADKCIEYVNTASRECKKLALTFAKDENIIKAYKCMLEVIYEYIVTMSEIDNIWLDIHDLAMAKWCRIGEGDDSILQVKIDISKDIKDIIKEYGL